MSISKSLLLLSILGVLFAALTYYVAIRGPVPFQSTDLGAVHRGMVAPEFELSNLDGEMVRLEDLRGKVVLLNFWATWCEPCLDEMPSLEKFYQRFRDRGLVVLAVNLNERAEDLKVFLKDWGVSFPVLLEGHALSRRYGTDKVPETYVIDARGIVYGKIVGAQDWMSASSLEFFEGLLSGT